MRAVIHFRIESLFTSVEVKRRPELAEKPVMVARSSGNSSGIVVSVSPEARGAGACEGMTVRHAQRLCPDGVFVSADYALYRSVSSLIMDTLSRFTPLLEPDGLDRAWLDVTATHRLFGGPRKIALEVVREIDALGYRAGAGIASNKLISQVASLAGGVKIVAPGREEEFLAPLPVAALPGVGDKTARRLDELGVRTIGHLRAVPERLLARQFGVTAERLRRLAQGVDHTQVKQMWPPEVIKIEHMFTDSLSEPSEVEAELGPISERLALELRSQNRLAETIEFAIKCRVQSAECRGGENTSPNPSFVRRGTRFCLSNSFAEGAQSSFPPYEGGTEGGVFLPRQGGVLAETPGEESHQHLTPNTQHPSLWRLKRPVNRAADILFALKRLLPMQMRPGMEAEGVSITLSGLTTGDGLQLCLLGDSERRRRLDVVMESVHSRFGDSALTYASSLAAAGRESVLFRVAM